MTTREATPYGFRFGPMLVERCMDIDGRGVVVTVKAGKRTLDVYCSHGGRSLRVFENGKELKVEEADA